MAIVGSKEEEFRNINVQLFTHAHRQDCLYQVITKES